jgi:ABC-type nitrate/sulfonate/bicarbonate transport system permease component
MDSTLSFSALIALTLLGLALYAAVALLEWLVVPWRRETDTEVRGSQ